MSHHLDIRGTLCPMNLLKVKLALEPLDPGAELEVVLDPGEGMENVPRALRQSGHEILRASDGEPCTLHIRKGNKP